MAHALPATFGLVAVLAIRGETTVRVVDIAIWAVVLCWDLFLLAFGWKRVGAGTRLARWVIADAAVMAALAFIGTPLRAIVVYAAIEGALFAAVFVSWRIAVLQIGIVYGAVGAAGLARDLGSDLPSPNTGWMLPLVVSLGGVLALTFLGRALGDLEEVTRAREEALRRKGVLDAEIEAERARTEALANIESTARPAWQELSRLVDRYRRVVGADSAAADELAWLDRVLAEGYAALREIDEVSGAEAPQPLTVVLSDAAARVRAAGLIDDEPPVDVDSEAGAWILPAGDAGALCEFVTEALTNACSHGQPPVGLIARVDGDGAMRVAIVDGGDGYDPRSVGPGMGLGALAEAAGRLRGRINAGATASGFEVSLTFVPRFGA